MSTVDPLVSFVETLKFGDFPKLLRLCEDKFTKSNRTAWSKRSEDKKMKYITCLSKVVNIVSGGETKECLEDFARGKRAKAFITCAQTGAAKTALAEKDINNLLYNLMVVYGRMQNKGRKQDACRLMILQALHGVRGIKVLRGLGWEIGDDTWSKVGRTITWSAEAKAHHYNRGPVEFTEIDLSQGGRPTVGGGAIQALRQTVLSPQHSRPIAGSFKKTDAPVGLTSSMKDVERDLKAQGQAVSYNSIRRLLGKNIFYPTRSTVTR